MEKNSTAVRDQATKRPLRAGQAQHFDTLVSAEGEDIYMHNLDNLNLPICFISGERNACYLPQSTEITYNLLRQKFGDEHYSRAVIANYGHIDCIFGRNAVNDVYPVMLEHLEKNAME